MQQEFKSGQSIQCVSPSGYAFTLHKVYTVLEYYPQYTLGAWTSPPYVDLVDDLGRIASCHAFRFRAVEE